MPTACPGELQPGLCVGTAWPDRDRLRPTAAAGFAAAAAGALFGASLGLPADGFLALAASSTTTTTTIVAAVAGANLGLLTLDLTVDIARGLGLVRRSTVTFAVPQHEQFDVLGGGCAARAQGHAEQVLEDHYSSRSDTVTIMPGLRRAPIAAGQRQV